MDQTNDDHLVNNALQYITNTGGTPTIEEFDDDHAPIGMRLRERMLSKGVAYESGGRILVNTRKS